MAVATNADFKRTKGYGCVKRPQIFHPCLNLLNKVSNFTATPPIKQTTTTSASVLRQSVPSVLTSRHPNRRRHQSVAPPLRSASHRSHIPSKSVSILAHASADRVQFDRSTMAQDHQRLERALHPSVDPNHPNLDRANLIPLELQAGDQ